ncbi:MAG TPA: hypothetical protein DDW52_27720, partial [Planctomycetaceae bacterium]|nr:hypothetical protein [Planctomycetaceae bacterium]
AGTTAALSQMARRTATPDKASNLLSAFAAKAALAGRGESLPDTVAYLEANPEYRADFLQQNKELHESYTILRDEMPRIKPLMKEIARNQTSDRTLRAQAEIARSQATTVAFEKLVSAQQQLEITEERRLGESGAGGLEAEAVREETLLKDGALSRFLTRNSGLGPIDFPRVAGQATTAILKRVGFDAEAAGTAGAKIQKATAYGPVAGPYVAVADAIDLHNQYSEAQARSRVRAGVLSREVDRAAARNDAATLQVDGREVEGNRLPSGSAAQRSSGAAQAGIGAMVEEQRKTNQNLTQTNERLASLEKQMSADRESREKHLESSSRNLDSAARSLKTDRSTAAQAAASQVGGDR